MGTKLVNNVLFGKFKIPNSMKHIPHIQQLWKQFYILKHAEDVFKNKLLNELISECNVNHSMLLLHRFGKELLIRLDFTTLQKYGLVLNHNSIVERLLSHLEPFPFDSDKLENKSHCLCLGKIRNAVEKQYLAWKYHVDEKEIEQVFINFKYCFYPFRSITNLRRSVSALESTSKTEERNIAEVIYLINQKPFNISTVYNFKEEVVGMTWRMFPHYCCKILRHSHQYIRFIVSLLQQLGFRDSQIRAGLPFLHLPFKITIFKLNNLLENPEFSKYRNEELFLHLLYFSFPEFSKLPDVSFTDLMEMVRISGKNQKRLLSQNIISSIVSQFYEIEKNYLKMIARHSTYRLASEKQLYDTLSFLKENNFTSNEVAESITIIFYPRDVIAKTLKKIKQDEPALRKIGFIDECVPEETDFFTLGTKEKRKTLQLCLYYLKNTKHTIPEDEMAEVV